MSVGRGTVSGEPATLPMRFAKSWLSDPSRPTVHVGGEWLTAARIDEDSARAAGQLGARGVTASDCVVWEAAATRDAIVIALGVLRLGAILVPVSERQSDIERSTVLADVDASLVIAHHRESIDSADHPVVSCDEFVRSVAVEVALDEALPEALAMIVFTSGTTGSPKGVMITHGNLAAQVDSLTEAWGWTPDDRLLSALPLFHVHGLVVALLASLAIGASIILESAFESSGFLTSLREEKATMTFCVPTMLHRIAGAADASALALLRLVVSGSAPLSASLFETFRREAGTTILERYGMSETLLTISNPLVGQRRPGTVGLALPGVDLKLPADPSAESELRVAGPTVFAGYWRKPEATAEVLADGWMSTGDIVRVDEAGYVVICGRSKELIISGGFNVYPTEVEDVLRSISGISDAAVVGRASDEWGEEVVAFVVGESIGKRQHEILDQLAGVLSPYKRPRRIIEIEELPRNALGKLQRHLL